MKAVTPRIFAAVLLFGAAVVGCPSSSGDRPAEATAPERSDTEKVAIAADITVALESSPDRADSLLSEHGLTREEYDALVREVERSPTMSVAYDAALAERRSVAR